MSNMNLYNSLLAGKLADGSDFSPTTAQLNAMNSGITSARVSQLAGIDNTGVNYIEVNNIRVYISTTAPTGEIPEGSIGIGF